jgi:hypothetical protein
MGHRPWNYAGSPNLVALSLEVAAGENQYPVQQLSPDRADPSFGNRVRLRGPHRCAQDADARAGEHGVEGVGELAVAIPDQERELSRAVAEIHQQIPRLLSNPGTTRVCGDAEEVDAAGGVLHYEQDVQPLEQQGVDAEEVGGEDAVGLGGQEPLARGPLRRGAGSTPARVRIDHTVLVARW